MFAIFRQVQTMEYSVIIFDTAPTGHTLRFLSFPNVLEKALDKLSTLSGRFGPMFQQVRKDGELSRGETHKLMKRERGRGIG